MTLAESIINTLVLSTCIAGVAMSCNQTTRADKDESRLHEMEQQMQNDAITSIYGVDPYRGTSIDILSRQLSETEDAALSLSPLCELPSERENEDSFCEAFDSGGASSEETQNDLLLTDFKISQSCVQFDFRFSAPNNTASTIEIFSSTNLTYDVWKHEFSDPIPSGITNHTLTLAWDTDFFPQSFFTYGWPIDSDMDGLTNLYELLVSKTNPSNADTDNDGLTDGEEVSSGRDPFFDEANFDFSRYSDEQFFTITGLYDTTEEFYDPTTNTNSSARTRLRRSSTLSSDPAGINYGPVVREPVIIRGAGLTFTPTVSGRFKFKIRADDVAQVNIGPYPVSDIWERDGDEGREYVYELQEGVGYPITTYLQNEGSWTELTCEKFGEYEVLHPACITNYFSQPAIGIRKANSNFPDYNISSIKGNATHCLFVNGGPFGGILEITSTIEDSLMLKSGKIAPTCLVKELAPYEEFNIIGKYEPNEDAIGSVQVAASFIENKTHAVYTSNAQLSIIQVYALANAVYPARERYVYGPSEMVRFFAVNIGPEELEWRMQASYQDIENDTVVIRNVDEMSTSGFLRMPPAVSNARIALIVNSVECFNFHVSVVAPKNIVGTSAQNAGPLDWARHSTSNRTVSLNELWSSMTVDISMNDESVSFSNIQISEGECNTESPSGSLSFMRNHPHDIDAGAWEWLDVDRFGSIGEDLAGVGGVDVSQADLTGYAKWTIPVYWRSKYSNSDAIYPFYSVEEIFYCTREGNLSVEKFGYSTSRSLDGEQTTEEL